MLKILLIYELPEAIGHEKALNYWPTVLLNDRLLRLAPLPGS